ncbi:MAG: OadG family protein [Eubacterium sp.]|nr:OadG family protein [Eubacterium sp.]
MALGELFRIAIADTVMGMGTVFVVLIFIAFIIWLLGFIPKWEEKRAKAKAAASPAEAPAPAAARSAAEPQGDAELVAVITAAVMAYMESEAPGSSDGYVVRNIRRAAWRHTLSE